MQTATVIFIAILVLMAPAGQANCPSEIAFSKSPQTLGVVRTFALDIGDVDRDGDNDVFISSYHYYWVAPSRLWLNNGDGTFSLSPQSFPVSDGHGVAIRDFNGDTYLDIFLLSNTEASKVFFGDGSGSFTMGAQNIGSGSEHPSQMRTGDMENDGDLDVVMGTAVGVQIWLNDGTGLFTLNDAIYKGVFGSVSLADVNGDSYVDLFIVLSNGPDEVWLNNGFGSFENSGQALGSSDGFGYPTSGDIDGDGDIDMVVGNSVHGVSLWLNYGNTGIFVGPGSYLDSGSFRAELFDSDLDGDLDLITAYLGSGTKVWKNNGAGSFSLVGTILGSPRGLAIGCADLDGDHDIDVVLGYDETCGGNPIYFDETSPCCCVGPTGNVNTNGIVDLSDLSLLVGYLTVPAPNKPTLSCPEEANVNAAGVVDLGDLSLLVAYLTVPAPNKPVLPNCPW